MHRLVHWLPSGPRELIHLEAMRMKQQKTHPIGWTWYSRSTLKITATPSPPSTKTPTSEYIQPFSLIRFRRGAYHHPSIHQRSIIQGSATLIKARSYAPFKFHVFTSDHIAFPNKYYKIDNRELTQTLLRGVADIWYSIANAVPESYLEIRNVRSFRLIQ